MKRIKAESLAAAVMMLAVLIVAAGDAVAQSLPAPTGDDVSWRWLAGSAVVINILLIAVVYGNLNRRIDELAKNHERGMTKADVKNAISEAILPLMLEFAAMKAVFEHEADKQEKHSTRRSSQ